MAPAVSLHYLQMARLMEKLENSSPSFSHLEMPPLLTCTWVCAVICPLKEWLHKSQKQHQQCINTGSPIIDGDYEEALKGEKPNPYSASGQCVSAWRERNYAHENLMNS